MGNKFIVFLLPLALIASSKYPDIDQLIEKVKVTRVGLKQEQIKALKNPFVSQKKLVKIIKVEKIKKEKKRQKLVLRLSSILNDRARINGRWYKRGSKIGPYRIVQIGDESVLLRSKKRFLRLFIKRKHPRLKLIKLTNGEHI